jgi:DNA polymerase delta subunit 3
MSSDFKKYLATEILSEQRTVSYRNVSRALKVHVTAAKCMLYEFHEFQNGKKPGSVYATYLLSGLRKQKSPPANGTLNGHKQEEFEDEPFPSSPPPFTSSMLEPSQESNQAAEEQSPQVKVRTITLVREESLEGGLNGGSDEADC